LRAVYGSRTLSEGEAELMAITTPSTSATTIASGRDQKYGAALATVTTLFFMWGFLTCLNDILVPHLKSIFDLNYRRSQFIQLAFFGAYFVFSFPASKIVDWIGYQRSMVVGLLTAGVGAFLFVPAASAPSFPLFLGALIVLAAGITCLQVAANPYVTILGKPETASSRLNLTQAFNSLGTFLAPFFGGLLILSAAPKTMDEIHALAPDALQAYRLHEAATVKMPYVGLGITLVLLAVAIGLFHLPKIPQAQRQIGVKVNDSIWKHPSLIFGAIGIFVYVGAEVSIGSFLVNYFSQPEIGGLTEKIAAGFVALYWGGAMIGRFFGSAVLKGARAASMAMASIGGIVAYLISSWVAHTWATNLEAPVDHLNLAAVLWAGVSILVRAQPLFALVAVVGALLAILLVVRGGRLTVTTGVLLGICAVCAACLVALSMLSSGHVAMYSIILVGFFNSIMFPSIFTLGVAELGPLTGDGSGVMIMAIVGGAILPVAQGAIADRIGIHHAFFLPVICYLYILYFALSGSRPNSQRYSGA
jgi:FHS family L-fucose permease-like MFS transporter